ncbi:cell envelope integrity protein CreD [Roseibacterium beibuensis]|uniref:cell envelope integrity protein CreD n=1 Tax=[Roseibacterium] beibuensis TaxID=1193142 RepID=UPI00217DA1E2|nr:cell envelope integrity protein CreD [Roseibacterium beibuensis]MCS6626396.1 cell envelope integrity protein CreD [Roseibacterium beibuensis]
MARTPRKPAAATAPPEAAPAPVYDRARGPGLPRRSAGLKLLLVCGLALMMSIAALFVFALLMDRSNRAQQVADEVGGLMGGPQTFLGPVIAVPYTRPAAAVTPTADAAAAGRSTIDAGVWHIFPTRGQVQAATESEVRSRSLFKVPVYTADLTYSASFDLTNAGAEAPRGAVLDWSRAEIVLGASDARGAKSDIGLTLGGQTVALTPSTVEPTVSLNRADGRNVYNDAGPVGDNMRLFGTRLPEALRAGGTFDVSGRATFSGAQRIAVLPFAGTTTAVIRGDWPHPSYNGGFLPVSQDAADGFNARWTVPFVARGVPVEGDRETLSRLGSTSLGVTFVEPANPYQSVSRSLKYAPLFIGLVFLTYFLFETTTGRRVHPAQYILVGSVQVIFYMLLLSIAEHTGFDIAFALAAAATVGLISAYAGWAFESRMQGLRALVAFSFLYGLIYVLMRLEDYAMLVGAFSAFAALAAVMYFTRKVDWYGIAGNETRDIA